MDKAEQTSLFSRLLEALIRHAIKKKSEENALVEKQILPKSGSTFFHDEFMKYKIVSFYFYRNS